jgi:hypothetical protein
VDRAPEGRRLERLAAAQVDVASGERRQQHERRGEQRAQPRLVDERHERGQELLAPRGAGGHVRGERQQRDAQVELHHGGRDRRREAEAQEGVDSREAGERPGEGARAAELEQHEHRDHRDHDRPVEERE